MWAIRMGPRWWGLVVRRTFRSDPTRFVYASLLYVGPAVLLVAMWRGSWLVGVLAGGPVGLLGFAVVIAHATQKALRKQPDVAARIGPIRTERLLLRSPTSADADAVVVTIDEEVLEIQGWPDAAWDLFRRSHAVPEMLRNRWLVTVAATGEVVGCVACSQADLEAGTLSLGWWLGPSGRGHGYQKESVAAVLDALHEAGVRRVKVITAASNVSVRKVLAAVGATMYQEGPHELPNGREIDGTWWAHEVS